MKKFKDLEEMYIDADNEAKYKTELFKEWFTDIMGIYTKLSRINTPSYFLIGRKGTGKTAYASMLELDFPNSRKFNITDLPYEKLNSLTKKNSGENALRFTPFWEVLIYYQIYSHNHLKNEVLRHIFSQIGFEDGFELNDNIRNIKSSQFRLDLKILEFKRESENTKDKKESKKTISECLPYIKREILNEKIDGDQIITIDGIDTLLKFNKSQIDILGGLITAITNINKFLLSNGISVKVIGFLRDDMVNLVNGTDMNKVLTDHSVKLDWLKQDSTNLMTLFKKRIHDETSQNIWYKMYPEQIDGVDSFKYYIDRTLSRPRDIVFLIMKTRELYPNHSKLNQKEFKWLLKECSLNLYEEMKNELNGFMDELIIKELDTVLKRCISTKSQSFKYKWFVENFESQFTNEKIAITPKEVVEILFERGYLGFQSQSRGKLYTNFKHKDPNSKLNLGGGLVLHMGLHSAIKV